MFVFAGSISLNKSSIELQTGGTATFTITLALGASCKCSTTILDQNNNELYTTGLIDSVSGTYNGSINLSGITALYARRYFWTWNKGYQLKSNFSSLILSS